MCIYFCQIAVGVLVFDERLGCFEKVPPPMAHDFIQSISGLFKYMNPLMFNPLFKYFPTNDWRQFEKHFSRALDIGREILHKV